MSLIGKLKRKDIDQVNDDFSDFSLSSPATKIRRLDANLHPIIEEDPVPENDEKAIVLFYPNPLHNKQPSPTLFFSLNSELISGFKNRLLQESEMKSTESTEESRKDNKGCLAVVPWFPSRIPSVKSRDDEDEVAESMETDEMDVEENCSSINGSMQEEHGYQFDGLKSREVLHNCMPPQPPRNLITPITWSE